ncbi:hypothetical protein SLEP1_g55762 [Rubroshorea leprosula]|uniref:Uncharacterized protein n=1 Tax=Rubroshorea leprosula TaxID=152421 RepID=A0AAV5MHJ1_9ROSI|nr:hypothetical protein SLEP1_g55762 [Rubroshorea leprosula]
MRGKVKAWMRFDGSEAMEYDDDDDDQKRKEDGCRRRMVEAEGKESVPEEKGEKLWNEDVIDHDIVSTRESRYQNTVGDSAGFGVSLFAFRP